MAYKYTGGKTVTVTVGNLAQDTIACAYWYTGAVSPTGASYTIKGLLDDGNNSTSTDFAYNTVLKATASSPSSTSVTFKTVDNIYDSTNGRYPKYVLAYVKLLPHFHNGNTFGAAIKTANIEIRQRQNSITCNTSSITDYWNRGNATQYTVNTSSVNYSPSNAYVSTMNVSSNNSAVASVSSSISNSAQLPITLKSKGTATITISPGDGAGGTAKTISVTSKTGVTSISASYTGDLNTGAATSITVSKTPSNADATTFTIAKTSGSASIPSSSSFSGTFSASATSGSPVLKFTSADGLVSKSIKITNHTATLSCSGSTPIKNQTFTYTKTGGYGSGTYTFSGCQHSSAGKAKVTATSGSATVTWTPSDGGWAQSTSIALGNSTTAISATGYTANLNVGADTTVTVSPTPSNPKVGTFKASLVSGTATISTSNTNYGSFSIKDVANAPVIKFTSGDGFVNKSIKITTHTATLSCSGTTPIKNETFSYNISGQYGTGTYTFSGCQHSSAGKAKVTATSGSASVTWTPSDGGWARSGTIQLGVSTTKITINNDSSSSAVLSINKGATAKMKVNLYGPSNATPKNTNFTASISGTGTLSSTTGTNGGTINVTGAANGARFNVTSGDGLVSSGQTIAVYTPSVSITASTPIRNQTFTYAVSGQYGSGTWTFTNCSHSSTGTAKVTANSGTATVKWTPADGGTAVSNSTTLGVTTTAIAMNGSTSLSASHYINKGAKASFKVNLYGPNNATPKNTNFTASISGSPSGTLSATSGTNGGTITVTNPANNAQVHITSGDKFATNYRIIIICTPVVSITASTPVRNQTFTYSLTGNTGSGTWTFSGCQHSSAGTAKVIADSGTATVTWTPADGGNAVSKSTTLGVTPTSITFNGATVNKGGTAYLQAYMYGPNSSTPKYNSIVVTYSGSGTPSGWSHSSTVATPALLKVTSINNTFTVTGKYSDSYGNTVSGSGIISVKTPSASVARNTSATLGNVFTYTVSNHSGTGTWTFSGASTSPVSTGKRKMTTNGTVTAKWTPADGGTAVTAKYTYNTGSTTLSKSLVSDNATYYGNGIYWDKYSVSMTNPNGRKITVAVSYGYVGTTTSSTSTSISVASGTSIYIRRTASQSATVTLSASAYTNAGTTSYTFYSKPSNVTFSIS